jgi:hypothetical protein
VNDTRCQLAWENRRNPDSHAEHICERVGNHKYHKCHCSAFKQNPAFRPDPSPKLIPSEAPTAPTMLQSRALRCEEPGCTKQIPAYQPLPLNWVLFGPSRFNKRRPGVWCPTHGGVLVYRETLVKQRYRELRKFVLSEATGTEGDK